MTAPKKVAPEVHLVDGNITTSSLMIAKHFGKNHRDILKAIKNLDCPTDFIERNFAPNDYKDKIGRTLPCFEITRDGFAILVMGFTGKKAMEWKISYLEAFNQMEQKLAIQSQSLAITKAARRNFDPLRAVQRSRKIVTQMICADYGVTCLEDITPQDFRKAMSQIQRMKLGIGLSVSYHKDIPHDVWEGVLDDPKCQLGNLLFDLLVEFDKVTQDAQDGEKSANQLSKITAAISSLELLQKKWMNINRHRR